MPTIRMTDVVKLSDGKVLVDFDDGATLSFKDEQEMKDAYNRFLQQDLQWLQKMLMIGDYLRRGDDTMGCDYSPENPSAVWVRRVN